MARRLTATVAAVTAAAGLTLALVSPLRTASAGPPSGGTLVEETVFDGVVKQEYTDVLVFQVPGLDAAVLEGVDLTDDAAIRSALAAAGVDPGLVTISRQERLVETTFATTELLGVVFSSGAVVLNCTPIDPPIPKAEALALCDLGTIIVVEGTVFATTYFTTTETRHIERITTVGAAVVASPSFTG